MNSGCGEKSWQPNNETAESLVGLGRRINGANHDGEALSANGDCGRTAQPVVDVYRLPVRFRVDVDNKFRRM